MHATASEEASERGWTVELDDGDVGRIPRRSLASRQSGARAAQRLHGHRRSLRPRSVGARAQAAVRGPGGNEGAGAADRYRFYHGRPRPFARRRGVPGQDHWVVAARTRSSRTRIIRRRQSSHEVPHGICAAVSMASRRSADVGWRAAVDSLRPHSHALWQALIITNSVVPPPCPRLVGCAPLTHRTGSGETIAG